MRRSFLWIGGISLSLVAAFIGLALLLGRTQPTFEFLKGHQAIPHPPGGEDILRRLGVTIDDYSFKADFAKVVAAAREELLALGYREVTQEQHKNVTAEFAGEGWDAFKKSPTTAGAMRFPMVSLVKDDRIEHPYERTEEKGWISVRIQGEPPKSFFDKLREFIGL